MISLLTARDLITLDIQILVGLYKSRNPTEFSSCVSYTKNFQC
jgi:hypothetical protein